MEAPNHCDAPAAPHVCEYKNCNMFICDVCKTVLTVRVDGTIRVGAKIEGV